MKETYIVELFDYYSSNGATITELETYLNAKKVSYRVLGAYDSTTKGLPYYWNNTSYWSVDKLSNGNKTYTDNPTGSNSSTLFIYNNSVSTAGQGNWARFSIETDSKIDKIIITAGSPEGRIPRLISVYRVKGTYDSSILSNRSLGNLEEIKVLTLNSTNLTPMDFIINFNKARLSIKSPTTNEHYSLSDKTLIHLPNNLTKNMILHGIEQGKEIHLDVPFTKHNYFNDTPVANVSGKVFTHDIGKINTLSIREMRDTNFEPIYTWYETKMTANNTPAPLVASASSQFDENYDPFNVFDGFSNSSSLWATLANAHSNSWIQIDFGNIKKINMIQLTPRNTQYINQTPKNFYVQTSKDSKNWITVGEFDISDWVEFNPKMLQLKFSEARYCKIVHRTTNGGLSACWAEILYGLREVK